VFGFSSSSTAAYQQIAIPTSLFGANGLPVTTLKFNISGPAGSSSIGGYIDEVTLQGGLNPPALPTTLMNFRGTYSTAVAYNPNDVACGATGICYVALLANTNTAQTTAADWTPLSASSVQNRRACVFDNDTQSATALIAAQFSGHCVVPFAATIIEVDVSGGTQTLTGSAAAPTFTGTSSIQIGKHGVTNNTALLSGALATASGVACALTSTAGTCLFNNGMTSSGTITISTTSISAGDELYVSAATADATQTWYTVAIIFTVN